MFTVPTPAWRRLDFLHSLYQVHHEYQVASAAEEGGVRLGDSTNPPTTSLQLHTWTNFFRSLTHFSMFAKDAALWGFFLVLFLCHKSRKEHQVMCSHCVGRKTFRSLHHQSDFDSAASPRNSPPVQDDFSYGCLSSSSSSPPLLPAVLPEMRRCWQCLCNNRWKLEINTSCLSRYSPLSIYF